MSAIHQEFSAYVEEMGRIEPKVVPLRDNERMEPFSPSIWHGTKAPARRWLVDGLITAGTVTMLSGDGGHGKSLLAQQLLTCLATRNAWLGFPVVPMKVYGMFCEDDLAELHRRQDDINEHLGTTMDDIADTMLLESRVDKHSYLCGFPDRYGDAMRPTPLWFKLVETIKEFGAQGVLLDTARKTFGGNEINDKQVSRFVTMLRHLAIAIHGFVMFTMHPSNEGIASGSGIAGNRAWRNEVRSMMYLTDAGKQAEDKPDVRILRVRKSNYGPSGGKIELKWQRGVFVRDAAPPLRDWNDS